MGVIYNHHRGRPPRKIKEKEKKHFNKDSRDLKAEIKKAAEEYRTVKTIEIATLKQGLLAVWINGSRFGNYDINKKEFVALMA